MRRFSRRQFAGSVGAGLLLAPFINLATRRPMAQAAVKQAKRVLLFCSMGTKPSLWTPTGISGETINTWSAMTKPLDAVKANILLDDGTPTENPNNGHGASDSLTGQGFGYYGQGVIKISVDQFIAKKLVAAGINRPIGSLLLGANTSDNGASRSSMAARRAATCRRSARRCRRTTPCSAPRFPRACRRPPCSRAARASSIS